jgi:hypothetical protein
MSEFFKIGGQKLRKKNKGTKVTHFQNRGSKIAQNKIGGPKLRIL